MYDHDFMFLWAYDAEGRSIQTRAPSLSGMEKLFTQRGIADKFDDFIDYEQTIWDRLDEELERIDVDEHTYENDAEYPADFYRDFAKFKVEHEARNMVCRLRRDELAAIGIDAAREKV